MPRLLDTRVHDEDVDDPNADGGLFDDEERGRSLRRRSRQPDACGSEADFRQRAAEVYELYADTYKRRFKWLRPDLFVTQLAKDLAGDANEPARHPQDAAATGTRARTPS